MGSKSHLESARDTHEDGERLRSDEAYDPALAQFNRAVSILDGVAEALDAIDQIPPKLKAAFVNARMFHDTLRKRVAQSTIELQVGRTQHHQSRNEAGQSSTEAGLKTALSGIESAIETAKRCNDALLLDDSESLSLSDLQRRQKELQRQIDEISDAEVEGDAGARSGKEPLNTRAESSRREQSSEPLDSSPTKEDLLKELQRLATEVGEPPTPTQMRNHGRYDASHVSETFGTWRAATEVAGVSDSSPPSTTGAQESGTAKSQLDAAAFETSWESIPENERLEEQLLVRVTGQQHPNGDRKTAILELIDRDGTPFKMDIWTTHDIEAEFTTDTWYAVKHARGKVWGHDEGDEFKKRLSSTTGLEVHEIGPEKPDQSRLVDSPNQNEKRTPATDSQTDESSTTTGQASNTAESDDAERLEEEGGILEDIKSEFE